MDLSRRIFAITAALLFTAASVRAQSSLSADVEIKQVANGSVKTTLKHVYCSSGGRLVSRFSRPGDIVTVANPRGLGLLYNEATGEVLSSEEITSTDDLMYIFLSRGVYDLGLLRFGYTLASQRTDREGYLIKTFTSSEAGRQPVAELVFKDYLPVYLARKNSDGRIIGKQYFSDYKPAGRLMFPGRVTEIIYLSAKDSTVTRTLYTNVQADAPDELAGFEVPSDAKAIAQ